MHLRLLPLYLLLFLWSCQENAVQQKAQDKEEDSYTIPGEKLVDPVILPMPTDSQQLLNKVAEKWHQEGMDLGDAYQFRKAIAAYDSAIQIRQSIFSRIGPEVSDTAILEDLIRSVNNKGVAFNDMKDFREGEKYLKMCLSLQDQIYSKWGIIFDKRKAWAQHNLALIYKETREQKIARQHLDLAQIYFDGAGDEYEEIVNWQNDRGDVDLDISDLYVIWLEPDSVRKFSNRGLNKYGEFLTNDRKAGLLNNLAISYELDNQEDKALSIYDNSISLPPSSYDLAKVYHNKVFAYLKQQQFTNALSVLDSAIRINMNSGNADLLVSNFNAKADIFLKQGLNQEAISWADSSIHYNIRNLYSKNRIDSTLIQGAYSDSSLYLWNRQDLLDAISNKAIAYSEIGDHQKALELYDLDNALLQKFRRNLRDINSKNSLSQIAKSIFEGAIRASIKQGKKGKAFEYAEQSKAFALLEAVKHEKAIEIEGLEEFLETERIIRIDISNLEQDYLYAGNDSDKKDILLELEALQEEHRQVLDRLNQNDKYRSLMSDMAPRTVSATQQEILEKDQVLIEYFVGDSTTYIFVVPPSGEVAIERVHVPRETVDEWTRQMREGFYDWNNDDSIRKLGSGGTQLYNLLITPIKKYLSTNRLLIIPDGVLGYIPFDALVESTTTNLTDISNYTFLGEKYRISYCYSTTLLHEMQTKEVLNKESRMLAFSPYAEFDTQVVSIKKELEGGIGGMEVDTLLGSNATIEQLHRLGLGYPFLHFSTHGYFENQAPSYSYLRLWDSKPEVDSIGYFYLYDLYNLQLDAEMVVTSACEVGLGKLYRGEGILSLARGFSQAGAKSIITTLWKVNASSTKDIIDKFYYYLKQGKPKDEALFLAKRDFLEKDPGSYHPYYWAGIIPIGDMQPVSIGMSYFWWVLAGGLGVAALGLWYWSRRRKLSKN